MSGGTSRALLAQISPGPLSRAHVSLEGATNCVKCHALNRAPMVTSCLSCHTDVKQLIADRRGYHARLTPTQRNNCASCHPDHAGVDFDLIDWGAAGRSRFDHRQAGWALEGKHAPAKCESCHTTKFRTDPVVRLSKRKAGTPWIGLQTGCASCHRTDDVHRGALSATCASCHDARAWAPAPKFDHDSARYPLTGKHADVKCASCHETARLPVLRNAAGDRVGTFRPLPFAGCNDCHTDPHKGRIRGTCSSCHSTTGWDEVETKGFDHAATRYPLRGRHARTNCVACHGRNNERPTPAFTNCASCHADVHRAEGAKRGDCAACHDVQGFAPSTFSVAAHANTAYPLEGRHRAVKCAACHVTQVATASTGAKFVRLRVPASNCTDCHADAHGGQPATSAANAACSSCHDVQGFAPSHVTVARHAAFRMPLAGAHARVACAACHGVKRPGLPAPQLRTGGVTGTAGFAFAIGDTSCVACHVDPHGGKYGRTVGATCASCHDAERFRPSSITIATHARYGFTIEGAHQAVACTDCHRELSTPPRTTSLRIPAVVSPTMPFGATAVRACASCHDDAHNQQFVTRRDGGACAGCHTTDRFVGAARFDHERDSRFPLAGAHAKVACVQCHVPLEPAARGTALRRYRGTPTACERCHTGGRLR